MTAAMTAAVSHWMRRWAGALLCLAMALSWQASHAAELKWRSRAFQIVASDKSLPDFLRELGASQGTTTVVDPKVAGLVYVSALSPDAGETTAQQYEGFTTPPEFVIDTQKDGYGYIDLAKFKAGFAADTSDADAAFLRDSQVPINMSVFGETVEHAAWQTKPSWAVIATEDHAFDQAMLRHMAERIGAEITEVATSHAVFMTRADVVSETIERAAQAVATARR